MAKLLAVKGHPLTSNESFSVKGLEAFLAKYKQENPADEVEVLDVFQADIPEIDEDIITAWGALGQGTEFTALTPAQQDKVSRFNQYTEQFLNSDKVVVASPLWNLMIPARLKVWMDTIMVAGKTFRYTANGPEGLAAGKKVLHLQANGGVYGENDPSSQYVKSIFGFVGAETDHVAVEGHAYAPENAENILADFIGKVEAKASNF
ncbi:MAG: FMN-dependent NADH-azoreductase [Turicibacter sp.]|nr:FMN-dependent NADH-azoreductase [Turicibacter sp.]